jgi:hypothetical protein
MQLLTKLFPALNLPISKRDELFKILTNIFLNLDVDDTYLTKNALGLVP